MLLVLLPDSPRYTMVAATNARWRATHSSRETLGRGLFEVFPDNPEDPAATGTSNLRASLERVLETRAARHHAGAEVRHPRSRRYASRRSYWSPKNLPVVSASGEVALHPAPGRGRDRAGARERARRGAARPHQRRWSARSCSAATSWPPRCATCAPRTPSSPSSTSPRPPSSATSATSSARRSPSCWVRSRMSWPTVPSRSRPGAASASRPRIDNALRLLKLVNALLDFSRIEAGRMQAHFAADRSRAADRRARQQLRIRHGTGGTEAHHRLPAATRACVRGPGDVGEDRAEPHVQRVQAHLPGRCGSAARLARRQGGAGRRGQRYRHRPGRDPASVRALPPRQGREVPHPRGHRHRPVAGARAGARPRRLHPCREHPRPGQPLRRDAAAGQRPPARRPGERRERRTLPARGRGARAGCRVVAARERGARAGRHPGGRRAGTDTRSAPAHPAGGRQRRHAPLHHAPARPPVRRARRARWRRGARSRHRHAPGPGAVGRHDAAPRWLRPAEGAARR